MCFTIVSFIQKCIFLWTFDHEQIYKRKIPRDEEDKTMVNGVKVYCDIERTVSEEEENILS